MSKNILLIFAAMVGFVGAAEFHISPSGRDDGAGTLAAPFRTLAKAKEAMLASSPGPGREAMTIWVHGGRYPIEKTLKFGPDVRGTREFPIRVRAVEGETPVFDAGLSISMKGAKAVTEESTLGRLPDVAHGKVMMLRVEDPVSRTLLASASSRLSINGRMMTLAKYPNVGFTHIAKILNKGAIYAHGRTKGNPPEWSVEKPIGGVFTVLKKDISAWSRELESKNKIRIKGYLAFDWYKEDHAVGSIRDGEITLADYSRYGILSKEKIPRRFIASNLLCELDAPNEFYFDDVENTLFFIPPGELSPESSLSLWGGPGLASYNGASYTTLEGLVIEGVGKGPAAVLIESGNYIRLLGCTVRNCSRPAVVINGGRDNGLTSCDIYDVASHLNLQGGDVRSLKSGRNFAINCHFTQVVASEYYGGIRVRGVGQVFRNNLIHNCPGQIMTFGGCDHKITKNEIFNIGFEEGDGGAIYSGASSWSWGNLLKNNFLHHLMCLPQAHPRGGIYPDDGDMGETIEQNVFYKAGHRAVLINGGAGHKVLKNVFIDGHIGIYNTQASAENRYKMLSKFDKGELKRGDKDDWVWRTEQVIGKEGWNQLPWSRRFPVYRKIMNQERMRNYPIECEFVGNRFHGNWREIEWRVSGGDNGVKDVEKLKIVKAKDNVKFGMKVFRDPEVLDFGYKTSAMAARMPKTNFSEIGLIQDGYRKSPLKASMYRAEVRKHFNDRKSFDPKAVYDPETVNEKIYFNSGRLLFELGGMIHGTS